MVMIVLEYSVINENVIGSERRKESVLNITPFLRGEFHDP